MSLKSRIPVFYLFLLVICQLQAQTKLTIDLSKKGVKVSPTQSGLFFEDINHAADGGLYAELIRNRSFEDAATLDTWSVTKQPGVVVTATIETLNLLNTSQSRALKLKVDNATTLARAGISNPGFWGINVVNGQTYKLTFFAKCDTTFKGSITASLESSTGVKYAQATITGLGQGWQKYSCTLTASGNNTGAVFVLAANTIGTVWFDVVSLFPPTFNNRENGLRPDLAQMLVDLKPSFLRFPGGCFIEGDYLANRFQWKKTIGPIETRPGHLNLWGYRTSDGMGFQEFLQLAEDLKAAPLFVVNVGLAHNDNQAYNVLGDYIQDALDALEYANGAVTTPYGAMRAANGHPETFNIKYIEIGNENYSGDNYGNRYLQFYNAIKSKYPDVKCIGNVAAWGTDSPTWTFSSPVDLVDEHYYRNPQWFIDQYKKYDTYSRNGPKIYAGEYAVTSGCGNGNLIASLGEAVYMAGMEKNSDMVPMNSYAPIFVNVNDRKWNPDMINYNSSTAYGTPSYYVQKMFTNNTGSITIPVKDSLNTIITPVIGSIGLGSWSTQVDYSAVSVKNVSNTILFSDQFTSTASWTPTSGTWAAAGGIYSQTATSTDCRSIGPVISDTTYTYSLKARKTSGGEGFLIIFGYQDTNNFYWWNIGGWGNTKHAIEQNVGGTKTVLTEATGKINTNQWYDIRIEVTKTRLLFYLDNVLIHSLNNSSRQLLYTSATLDESNHQLFLKVINPSTSDVSSNINVGGISGDLITGKFTVLSSVNPLNENSLDNKTSIVPVETSFSSITQAFNCTFKANSFTILQLNTSTANGIPVIKKNESPIQVFPNPAQGFIQLKGTAEGMISVKISSLTGQILLNKGIQDGSIVDLSDFKAGVYLLEARQGGYLLTTKLLKE